MHRKWLILIAVSIMFFFISAATFMSLGVVLFEMIKALRWTQTEAGVSFSILGLACCLSSPVPMALVSRIGSHWTMAAGGFTLAAGFALAALTHVVWQFYLGTALMGVGFSLSANIPGVYLVAEWFPQKSGRIIGAYLMCGAFGGVAGPPAAQALIAAQGWRVYWAVLAVIASGLGLLCSVLIRDKAAATAGGDAGAITPDAAPAWSYRAAMLTPQFAILAASMVVTEACVTIVHSAAVIHFSKLGIPSSFAALMLSLQALMATMAKGGSGALGDWLNPRRLLVGGLVLEGLGMIVLGSAGSHGLAYTFAILFGIGWGTAYLTITVLLIDYFGPATGSAVLSLVWLLTAFASLGPAAAGLVADRFGTFTPVLDASGALLLPLALAALLMRRPTLRAMSAPERASSAAEALALENTI